MSKLHIKKGDTVYVNSGEDKGKTGRVLKVLVDKKRAIVEGTIPIKKYLCTMAYVQISAPHCHRQVPKEEYKSHPGFPMV